MTFEFDSIGSLNKARRQAMYGELSPEKDTGHMLKMLYEKYTTQYKAFFKELSAYYGRSRQPDKQAQVKSGLLAMEKAVAGIRKLIGVGLGEKLSEDMVAEAFDNIIKVENVIRDLEAQATIDVKLSEKFDRMRKEGFGDITAMKEAQAGIREHFEAGGADRAGLFKQILQASPELAQVGESLKMNALIGIFGPFAEFPMHVLNTIGALRKGAKQKKLKSAKSRFESGISGFTDEKRWSENKDRYGRFSEYTSSSGGRYGRNRDFSGSEQGAAGRAHAAGSRDSDSFYGWGNKYGQGSVGARSGSGSGSGYAGDIVDSLFEFFHHEAYKTRYLADLMDALDRRGGGGGGLLSGLLGGAAVSGLARKGLFSLLIGSIAGFIKSVFAVFKGQGLRGGIWGPFIKVIGRGLQGLGLHFLPLMGRFTKFLAPLVRFGAFLGKWANPIGWAITGIMAFVDALNGWKKATSIFGKSATLGQKFASALGGVISGLTLGLVKTEKIAPAIYRFGKKVGAVIAKFARMAADFALAVLDPTGLLRKGAKAGIEAGKGAVARIGNFFGGKKTGAFDDRRQGAKAEIKASKGAVARIGNFFGGKKTGIFDDRRQAALDRQVQMAMTAQGAGVAAKKTTGALASSRDSKTIPYRQDDPLLDAMNGRGLGFAD